MPTVTYSGTFKGITANENKYNVTLTGTYIPLASKVTGITYTLVLGSGGYSSSNYYILTSMTIGGGASKITSTNRVKMTGTRGTLTGSMTTCSSVVFAENTLDAYIFAYTDHSSTSNLQSLTIEVTYEELEEVRPVLTVTQQSDGNFLMKWTEAYIISGSELVKCDRYKVYKNNPTEAWDTSVVTTLQTTVPVDEEDVGKDVHFWVDAYKNSLGSSNYTPSNTVTLHVQPLSRYISYCVNGSWVDCVPYYGSGGSWVECIPHYGSNGSWVECSK